MRVVLVVVVVLLVAERCVEAVFLYNRVLPKQNELEELGLKCIPGATVMKYDLNKDIRKMAEPYEERGALRTHMNAVKSRDTCRVCVCSVDGKDEYCSGRPARNVNECIRMTAIKKELQKNMPYSHEKTLAYRIRRDYIWHDDEIPYEAKATCRRGRSYYSNSVNANDTDIDVPSDVTSLLDYSNKDICFYCVCSVSGRGTGCISRDPVFCEYYRILRDPDAARNEYTTMFKQDRPAYFRQLSYRLRRKMDEGVFDLMESGGDTLCCDHPDGHRRKLHEHVRNKIRLMRRKVPKENILSGSPGVGSGLEESKCIPYVSQYTDCSDANACTGCTRCSCNDKGQWECNKVHHCPEEKGSSAEDEMLLEIGMDNLYEEMLKKKNRGSVSFVPPPPNSREDLLLVPDKQFDMEEALRTLVERPKRSINENNINATIKFYETVDEINEDTIKDLNSSGTIKAHKVAPREKGTKSRRTDIHYNASDISALHIEYNKPHDLEHHIAENNIDSKHPPEDKIDGFSHEQIHKILGNYSQIVKDKDLSKVVVNELTRGSERIGDKNVVPVSNITFTPENDTLTAMTFIAGNLLNKIWDMEKDANDGSFETEEMKHEKINDLLNLFKEPLTLRQENFVKNALEKLSHVIDASKDIKNMSICANIEDSEAIKPEINNCTEQSNIKPEQDDSKVDVKVNSSKVKKTSSSTDNAVNKINEVLNMMKKYEYLQKKMSGLSRLTESKVRKSTVTEQEISLNENVSLNLFGKILDKITNLLSPNKNGKRITKKIQNYNMLRNDNIAKNNLEKIFNIILENRTLSAKDKMLHDYITRIEKQPNCFFTHLQKPVVTPLTNVEGSILYNLSEFFKIKSFTDLLNIVNDKPDIVKYHKTTPKVTTAYPSSTIKSKAIPKLRTNQPSKNGKMESAKEKLKNDIKNILQDLIDLQKEHGIKSNSNINIADALPCIYNILKSDGDTPKDKLRSKDASSSIDRLNSFINLLKSDMKFMSNRRSTNTIISPRPKSAIVWERAITNLGKKYQKSSRRYLGDNPKTYKELNEMMDKVELSSNTYKNFAIRSVVAPTERLMILKTLQAGVRQYINVLQAIEKADTNVTDLPLDKQNDLHEFLDNANMTLNLNKKVVDHVVKLEAKSEKHIEPKARRSFYSETNQPVMVAPKWEEPKESFKLRRDQIMNQLMMNRLKLYIKTKERSEMNLNENVNYNIAKRVLFNLENGNIALAKELYKVFLENIQQYGEFSKLTEYPVKEPIENKGKHGKVESRKPILLTFKEPLVKEEEAQKNKMLTQDYFLKQLWNLKELKK